MTRFQPQAGGVLEFASAGAAAEDDEEGKGKCFESTTFNQDFD